MKPLIMHLRVYDDHAKEIIRALKLSDCAIDVVELLEKEMEIGRHEALEIRANWEMGIVEDFFNQFGDGER